MTLKLYQHPLASFCHKVLIALYENQTPFESVVVDLADPASKQALLSAWPVGKIPVLHDEARDRTVPETSIIIEYLAQHHPGPIALLPADRELALQARLWDRFFDAYVQVPMQKIVVDRLRP
ncbi:MAG: glutathione S-transferase family protein, partial [Polyangiales bacterium]